MKRRDIKFGDIQDECKRILKIEGVCQQCKYVDVCVARKGTDWTKLDLTDPPRFTEAQMAFWKQWIAWGARYAMENKDFPHIIEFMREGGMSVGKVFHYDVLTGISLNKDETLDLAELLGKDGAE